MMKGGLMKEIEAVFFDFDGTITCNSEQIASDVYEAILRECGVDPVRDNSGLIHIPGIFGNMALLKKKYGISRDLVALKAEWKKRYMASFSSQVRLRPGLLDLLQMFREGWFPIGVVSSANRICVETVLAQFHLFDNFFPVVCGEDVENRKPHPDCYFRAALQLEVDPRKCVVIEDSHSGILAGKAAGMKTIAVPNAYTRSQDFSQADFIVSGLHAISPAVLERL